MPNYFKDAKEYESKQRHRQKWVNVFDAWQLPLGGSARGASRIQGDADSDVFGTWIKVSSLADMVKQIRDVEDAESIGLRLHGATKARVSGSDKRERAYYIAVGGGLNDTSGQSSLQLTADGKLLGSARSLLEKLDRVVAIELVDATYPYELKLLSCIANALPGRFADIHAVYPGVEAIYLDRQDRNPFYAAWAAEQKAKQKPIQEAKLETGNLNNYLNALSGKPTVAAASPIAKRTYDVVAGDTLSAIAKKVYGNPSRWKDLFDSNRVAIGSDPNRLRAGMQLMVP